MMKGASEAFGVSAVLQDLGVTVEVVLLTDSSAGKGIVNRRGLGKVRHIGVNIPGSICERKDGSSQSLWRG